MALAALDPFTNAASKAPQTLGCLLLKPEQMQVVFWSVGRAVLATDLCSAVLPAVFDYWWSPSTLLALLTHIAAIKGLAGA